MRLKTRTALIIAILCVFALQSVSFAQSPVPVSNSDEPLEITADQSLEWRRNENKFVARQNAKAVQGMVSLESSILTADYRESDASNFDIWKITATDNVVIQSNDTKAYGDNAVYNLDDGLAVMTGDDLNMVSPEQTITARDRFEYWAIEGKLKAIGKAKVIRPKDTLEADEIIATLEDTPGGERKLKTLEAQGNVVITTATEVLSGDYGIYRAETNKAELTGNVNLKRGPNILQGERAEVDLTTDTSRLFGGGPQGRVRGVFYPNSEKKPDSP